jgi:predicted alpha/beta-hydrolase family hydrolase
MVEQVTIQKFKVAIEAHGSISACLYRAKSRAGPTLVLAHGAGAGQRSAFLVETATRLAGRGVAVVTFNFVYMEKGRRAPDRPDVRPLVPHQVSDAVRAGRARSVWQRGGDASPREEVGAARRRR